MLIILKNRQNAQFPGKYNLSNGLKNGFKINSAIILEILNENFKSHKQNNVYMVSQETDSNTQERDQSNITQTISENRKGPIPWVPCMRLV